MAVTISLPPRSTPSPDVSSPSSTLIDSDHSAPSSPGLIASSWQASGIYVPVHKRRQGVQSSASSPAMSTFELEPDTRRPTYTREALLQIARSPFVPLAPSSELLHAFPSIIRAHGRGIDQALVMSTGMRPSKSFHKYGHWEHRSESKGNAQHGRSRSSYGRNNKRGASPRFTYSNSDQSDRDSVHDLSSGSDNESAWRAH
ncbi:hypothetical protein SCHPADRAFT_933092 [Schizopora paradoxa]|uniref:Uncharacterized protein n=1 Tax=Schizopora paradoxa TaxID=27342 RepID=A0A0H2R507_9AGAM|nr:hypothetical protein SCHPADRAFT_933092 [Schizopora paradoxa]